MKSVARGRMCRGMAGLALAMLLGAVALISAPAGHYVAMAESPADLEVAKQP